MNVKISFAALTIAVLLAFSTHPAIADVTLAVEDNPVQAGTANVEVPIKVSNDALLAGASFTISYSQELTFVGVSSTYFGTFIAQGFEAGDLVPCDLNGNGTQEEGECETGDFFEQPLIVSADDTPSGGKKEVMIAAARINAPDLPGSDNTTILTLIFDTPYITTTGQTTYEVDIKRSEILNEPAGYATLTVIPMLVAFDDTLTPDSAKYPQIPVSNVEPVYPEQGLLNGTLTVTDGDTDGDDINDQWELKYLPSGETLAYFSKNGDRDGDGYSDYQEYINRDETITYDPTAFNAPDGPGYVEPLSGTSALPAIYMLLLGD